MFRYKQTVDTVTDSLRAAITSLEEVAERELSRAEHIANQIAVLEADKEDAVEEAEAAFQMMNKLKQTLETVTT